ncbi:FliH/SctL family protein [Tepidibacter hydrothermalis]|uniref:FliH/SctL family protein n=1 Tax=Tepidibacter hydrothermalis TaxID=3036126 RepID=A0ABY8EFE2_9FIRM|nr:FliH/SctL family protein [Tepidibacter hydrothermalis]WFD11675.1 FliH/SctL family protein [Tepidibacter hydrothermalis]
MSKIIKHNQVNISEEKIVGLQPRSITVDNKSQEKKLKIENEINNLILKKNDILKEIELIKQDSIKEKNNIIETAHKEYETIINSANEKAKVELDKYKQEGYQKGYEEGFEEGQQKSIEKYQSEIDEAINVKNSVIEWKKNEVDKMEKDIINLVINSVDKIIKVKLEENDDIILNLIKEALNKLTFTEKLIVRVSDDDFEKVNSSRDKILAMAGYIDDIQVKVDKSLEKGDLIIDTSAGTVNPSIKNQFEIIKEEFLSLV